MRDLSATRIRFALAGVLLLLLPAAPGSAYFTKGGVTGIGARALGLGATFTAISDDTSTVWWNPAGLGQLNRAELSGMYAAVFNGKVTYLFTSAAFPVFADGIMGLSWDRKDFGSSGLKEDVYYATFASTLTEDRTFFGGLN